MAAPSTVQIRATATPQGKLAAGAPRVGRDLSLEEIRVNARWFAVDRVGPRADPVQRIVLSGISEVEGWEGLLPEFRAWGITTITVHAPPVGGLRGVDRWVTLVREPGAVVAGAHAVVPLEPAVIPMVPQIARACVGLAQSVAFTLPFPPDPCAWEGPPLEELVRGLVGPIGELRAAGVPVGIKGIPPCLLGSVERGAELCWRTSNRWYVDADHQRDRALLFLPDVVRFAKTDDCRRCNLVTRCDGLAEGWLRAGLVERLMPVESAT